MTPMPTRPACADRLARRVDLVERRRARSSRARRRAGRRRELLRQACGSRATRTARSSARATARDSAAPRRRTSRARRCGFARARGCRARPRRARPAPRDSASARSSAPPPAARRATRASTISSRAPFSPMPGHALDVVDAVAHQRQHVDHLIRPHAELLDDARRVVPGAFIARVEDANAVADELEEILVAGDDRDLESGARAPASPACRSRRRPRSAARSGSGTPSASHASCTSGTCSARSDGIGVRLAL